jgi:hypothetical protein
MAFIWSPILSCLNGGDSAIRIERLELPMNWVALDLLVGTASGEREVSQFQAEVRSAIRGAS